MTPTQSTDPSSPRTDPFRWDHDTIAEAFDAFDEPDRPASQRQFARAHGIPRSTLGSWLRRDDPPDLDPALSGFLRSCSGLAFLRRLVLALFVVFHFRGCTGLRSIGLFLRLTRLDRVVASSHGALHDLAGAIQADLGTFSDEERPRLAAGMAPRDIALVGDENFHHGDPCLVAIEPVSNFILVEQYAAARDQATWTAAIDEAVQGLPVRVVLLTSDQAKGLIACAGNGLHARHLPEMFHAQRDLHVVFATPLRRRKESAEKELHEAEEMVRSWRELQARDRAKPRPGRPTEYGWRIDVSASQVDRCGEQVRLAEARQQRAADAVAGLADDYHPFDPGTGAAVTAADMQRRLDGHLDTLQEAARQADLGASPTAAVGKGRQWARTLVAAVAWFWSVAADKVRGLDLDDEAERVVNEQLLPGRYWQQAARRGRTAEDRRQRQDLAERLLRQAWREDGPLGRLPPEDRARVQRVGNEIVGLFARSSSCVEGRNGRLSLALHGQCRLSPGRLKGLTTLHNYLSERADGTTAAERFFGQKPRDLFDWLLDRLPDLPRPAAKRPRMDPLAALMPG